jgi:hypothetical protein
MNVGYAASKTAKAYLESLDLEAVENFYAEMEDPDNADGNTAHVRELPCVICFGGVGEEFPMFTGNYNIELNFKVMLSADDHTAAQLDAIYDELWEQISTDSILADLNTAAVANGIEFTAFGFTEGIHQTAQTVEDDAKGRILSKSIILPINCCAALIS